ncbi:hypothetical protein M3650_29815 [Paenibacillus sp. MER TA 81-3]|uniref:hypothetical protein n=1 Tax=Paenibacillus sp. MER TA 81-3 TaxID=2939573 RepID=UPI00203E940D|nr:hypothetical protein [Paenibacillus sp. MER TA 81-3]MCM3342707.1 hypothetical protein [Paenibacillus sp. MER TA 81-3]
MIKKRNFDEIMDRLEHRNRIPKISEFTRKDCLFLYEKLADNSIEADHVFLSYEKAKKYNKEYHADFSELKESHWIFAETGRGDFWIIDLDDIQSPPTVFFYDHDHGDFSPENMQNISIHILEWFELADLISQLHNKDFYDEDFRLTEHWRQKAIEEIEKIKKGLSKKSPFQLF